MNWETWIPVIVTVAGVLGSNAAWRFYDKRAASKAREDGEMRKNAHEDHVTLRDDLRERVSSLESKLESEYREKVDLLKAIAELKAQVAELKTKLELMSFAPRARPARAVKASAKKAPVKKTTKRA